MDQDLAKCFKKQSKEKATVFGYQVKDPERFGVVEFDDNQNALN